MLFLIRFFGFRKKLPLIGEKPYRFTINNKFTCKNFSKTLDKKSLRSKKTTSDAFRKRTLSAFKRRIKTALFFHTREPFMYI